MAMVPMRPLPMPPPNIPPDCCGAGCGGALGAGLGGAAADLDGELPLPKKPPPPPLDLPELPDLPPPITRQSCSVIARLTSKGLSNPFPFKVGPFKIGAYLLASCCLF